MHRPMQVICAISEQGKERKGAGRMAWYHRLNIERNRTVGALRANARNNEGQWELCQYGIGEITISNILLKLRKLF